LDAYQEQLALLQAEAEQEAAAEPIADAAPTEEVAEPTTLFTSLPEEPTAPTAAE